MHEGTFITTPRIRLHVIQSGPPDGPLVILLHGFPEFWYGWRNQIAPLSQAGFRLLIPDQRGYNLSDKPKGVSAYHIDQLSQDVLDLIESAGRDKACLVGHDWGAAVAWHTAVHHPHKIEKLAILNVPHPQVMQRFLLSSRQQLRKSWYIFFFQLPWLPEAFLRDKHYHAATRALTSNSLPGSFTPADLAAYQEAWSQPGALSAMIHWYRSFFRAALRRLLLPSSKNVASPSPRISMPTLILWGKNDLALSPAMAQPSLELCDQGQLIFFDHASHWVQHDAAPAVTQYLLDFLAPK